MKNLFTIVSTLLLTLLTTSIFAQGEGNNWIFGDRAGLNFETNPPTIISGTNLEMITLEGCASISNQSGELLFYTDGQKVWDKGFDVMPSSISGSIGQLQGASSSTQSAVVVPHPGNPNLYYISRQIPEITIL